VSFKSFSDKKCIVYRYFDENKQEIKYDTFPDDEKIDIEVEDDTFGRTLDGRKRALRVARDVLRPFFPRG
jgi:hypothetical protein